MQQSIGRGESVISSLQLVSHFSVHSSSVLQTKLVHHTRDAKQQLWQFEPCPDKNVGGEDLVTDTEEIVAETASESDAQSILSDHRIIKIVTSEVILEPVLKF